MRALRLVAFLLALPATGHGEPTSCAVQLRPEWRHPATPGLAGAAWLAALPRPPVRVQPLLAASSATPSGASSKAFAGGPGPADDHPMAAWHVLRFSDAASLEAALEALARHPGIAAVEPVRSMVLCAAVEPRGGAAPAAVPWNVARIAAPEALAAIDPDTTLIVAVIDTGADLQHPDLRARLWHNDDPPGNGSSADDANDQNGDGFIEDWERDDDDDNGYVDDTFGFDFTDAPGADGAGDSQDRDPDPHDDNGHGTHVAGIIAAQGGLQGVAPFVRLMPVRAAYSQRFGSGALETDDAAAAIVYAVDNGARVLNLSWGDREESLLIRSALDYAVAHGVVVVAAAGNGNATAPHYPSGDTRVIGVAASNRQGERAAFSNRGAAVGVEVAAPGEEGPFPQGGIPSLVPLDLDSDGQRDGYTERRGTSMAAAHVSGVVALILSRMERPDARRARALLVASARRAAGGDWSAELGHGEVDALSGVRTTDDLVVSVVGPSKPYRHGTLTLVGTVLCGASVRRSLLLQHTASGTSHAVFTDLEGAIVADTLVHGDFSSHPEGEWTYVLSAHSAEGRRRERHGAFRVDVSPAVVDTVRLAAAWRGGTPRWLLDLQADEPVAARVLEAAAPPPLFGDAGLAARIQIETAANEENGTSPLTLQLENEAGWITEVPLPRPPALPPWPEAGLLVPLGDPGFFTATSVWGTSPVGPVLWGFDAAGGLAAYAVEDERFQRRHEVVGAFGFPRAYADVNGDGAADLLLQTGEIVYWLLTQGPDEFPHALAPQSVRGRALGLFQLDEDAALETLVARRDTLFLYEDHVSLGSEVRQVLTNPNRTGFNDWGSGAAVGDFDGDGLIEIAAGDAEGFLSRFEKPAGGTFRHEETVDLGGTYAYEILGLPEGGLLVGRQRSVDVTGDGFPAAVYEFSTLGVVVPAAYPFLARENELAAGAVVSNSPATGATWLALVQGHDLYMARGAAEPRERVSRVAEAEGEPPVVADLDGDGFLEVVLPRSEGALLFRLQEERRGPFDLRAESLGAARLQLTWEGGEAASFRVWRRGDAWWEDLGTTAQNTWIDSTLQGFVDYTYELDGLLPDGTVTRSNTIVARAQPLPRWLEVQVLGKTGIRLRANNSVPSRHLEARAFVVQSDDGSDRFVDQVSLAEAGRAVDLVLPSALPCGPFTVRSPGLRDDQNGRFTGAGATIQGNRDCEPEALAVTSVTFRPEPHAIDVAWSREPDVVADAVSSYDLRWDGRSVPVVRILRPEAQLSRLHLAAGMELRGRGLPYVLRIVAPVAAREDGAPLAAPETEYRIYVEGQGAPYVFPAPNPVRQGSVLFVDAADDTRLQIFDLQGQLVRELHGALGGGLSWDLRNRAGQRVASGVYVYVARDARGTSTGRVAVLH